MSFALVPVRRQDLEALARIHAESFPVEAWDHIALAQILAMPGADGRIAMTARAEKLGFLLSILVAGEAEIVTLCVSPSARRRGVARALLADLFARTPASVVLEVAADNGAGLALYRAAGFQIAGKRRGYYRRPGAPPVDAWLLRRMI
ncbi:MAG TPA: GNAT family N-acetyltransferase [Stellaceae bacterium]|nr:GNAT family N-acetyltransferase [Stellaceae bacterium]